MSRADEDDAEARTEFEGLRAKVEAGERDVPDEDREALLALADRMALLRDRFGGYRCRDTLRTMTILAEEVGGVAACLEDREAAEALYRYIHDTYPNPETNQTARCRLRTFGDVLHDGDGLPESLAWIPAGLAKDYDPHPEEAELVTWEEVEAMARHAGNARDRALAPFAFELGARPFELYGLHVGDLSDDGATLRVTVRGAKGTRTRVVPLVDSAPYIRAWLADHPDPAESAPLWSHLTRAESVSDTLLRKQLAVMAERAGLPSRRNVTPSGFRDSCTRWLVEQGLTTEEINAYQGRARGSTAISRYLADYGEDSMEAMVLRKRGLSACEGCGKALPADGDRCPACGLAKGQAVRQPKSLADIDVWRRSADGDVELTPIGRELVKLLDPPGGAEPEEWDEIVRGAYPMATWPHLKLGE